jgi:hypothetical protein
MSQANFPLFPLTQQHTMISYGDVLNTPATSRDRVPLHGSGTSGSASSLDHSLLSPSPISLFTDSPMTTSSESPQMYAYTQLARQYQQSQDDLKKVNQEYGRLKYMRIIY